MALQLALAIDDAPLAASAVQAVYTSLVPLLRPKTRSVFLLQPLCACLEALRHLGPERLTSIRRAPHLLACVGFELATLASEWGLGRLAEHVAALDVAGFASLVAAAREAAGNPDAEVRADVPAAEELVGTVYAEYVAASPRLAPHGAPLPDGGDGGDGGRGRGVQLYKALAESEEATWAVLADAADDARALELTVRACGLLLSASPSEERARAIGEKLDAALEAATAKSRYLTLSELMGGSDEEGAAAAEEEPPPEDEDEEAAAERLRLKAAATFTRKLKGLHARLLDRRAKRAMHAALRPWRAQARLLLARCASLVPPPEPEEPAADPKAEGADDDDDGGDDDDDAAAAAPPPEGAAVLSQLSRAAVLAERAECPSLLLATCTQLRNTFDELPAAVDAGMCYASFQPMRRLSQADEKDPPPDIPPALWRPMLRASRRSSRSRAGCATATPSAAPTRSPSPSPACARRARRRTRWRRRTATSRPPPSTSPTRRARTSRSRAAGSRRATRSPTPSTSTTTGSPRSSSRRSGSSRWRASGSGRRTSR